jgi:hypothetical protein
MWSRCLQLRQLNDPPQKLHDKASRGTRLRKLEIEFYQNERDTLLKASID